MLDFSFLIQRAGFQVAESLFTTSAVDTYLQVLFAGLVNTLTVVAVALPFATLLGLVVGLLRLTRHPLLHRAAAALVEPVRNTPVLLQLFVWYAVMLTLPAVREAWHPLPGVYLSNRGLALPVVHGALEYLGLAALLAIAFLARRRAAVPRDGQGQLRRPAHRPSALSSIALVSALIIAATRPGIPGMEAPELRGLGLSGGWNLSPEFTALVLGLAVFHGVYISDIVRGAVFAVPRGQFDAARALGLRPLDVLRTAVYPYAARAGVPPYANQCLMLLKNTTLAIAIGYQELMAIINTTITQTGRALEGMMLATVLYWIPSVMLAAALGRYNAQVNRHCIDTAGGDRLGQWLGAPALTRDAALGSTPRFAISLALAVLAVLAIGLAGYWGVGHAVWTGDAAACQAAQGACWSVLAANWHLLLFGTLDHGQRVPALIATVAAAAGAAWMMAPRPSARWRACLVGGSWLVATAALAGDHWGGSTIAPVQWGGLLVTVVLAIATITLAIPGAVLLAAMRRSRRPWVAAPATAVIESVRAVPLVAQLLLISFGVPVLFGGDWSASKFQLALATLSLHTACLLAEVLRGAIQAVPASQVLSAQALGMRPATVFLSVVLPQARRIASPAALGVFVGAVKDTSLVMLIGVFDILSAARAVLADTTWRPYYVEVYGSVALTYFVICLWLSRTSERLRLRRPVG